MALKTPTVATPVITTPSEFACIFTLPLPSFNAVASIPVNSEPSPLKLVALTIPVSPCPVSPYIVTPIPTLSPTSLGPNSQLFDVLPHVKVLLFPVCEELANTSIPAPSAVVLEALEVEPIPTVLSATFNVSVLTIVSVPSTCKLPCM